MKDAEILIIVPRQNNTTKIDYSYMFPLGLGYISSTLKKAGYSVDCLNTNHYAGKIEKIVRKKLDQKKYDFVCTGNNALGYNLTEKIIRAAKKHYSRPTIILGGAIITSEPKTVFELLRPDIAVIGGGEETILELLGYLKRKKDISGVKGIEFRNKKGKIIFTGIRETEQNLDSLPWPDFEGFGFEEQLNHQYTNQSYSHNPFDYPRVYPILGSRGCPFNCTFCYHPTKYRKRSLDNIMKEIETVIKKYHINVLLFYDECIAADKERLFELCKRIKKLREKIPWDLKWSPQLTVHNIDEEMLKIMKDSGVFIASYGFESFSSKVLKSMRKPITPEMIEKVYQKTLKSGIGVQANFIFGDVAETKETAYETLDWWKKNTQGQIGLGFIQPYPGSEIYKHCLKKKIIKNKKNFIKNEISANHWYNMTDGMSDKEIKKLRKDILNETQGCRRFGKHKKQKIKESIYTFKVKCPFCKKIIIYKNCYVKNKWIYGFPLFCRNCLHRYFVVAPLQKLAYKFYPYVRFIRDYQLKISKPKK